MKLTSLIQEAVDERPQDVGLAVHRKAVVERAAGWRIDSSQEG
jgi:hypothetical protein